MSKKKNKNKIRMSGSDRTLKICAVVLSLMFAALMLYPFIFAVSGSMKNNSEIYEVPPKLLPSSANSVSLVADYSDIEGSEEELKDLMQQDSVLAMFGINYKMGDQSIMEVQFYGTRDGKTVFHSRAHQMKLQMECDYGIFTRSAIKKEVILHGDRYLRASESLGYEFDLNGISKECPEGLGSYFKESVTELINEKYPLTGKIVSVGDKRNNWLNVESFKYYLQMPGYIYPKNETIAKFGFMTFVGNSVIVIGFAMIAQVILCSVCAFVISRLLTPRAGKVVLMFFMGAMMVPFASIMLPQLVMYREMGAYNNYAALLLPFLYPYGFYVYLYKGFLIRFLEAILRRLLLMEPLTYTYTVKSVCRCQNRLSL